MFRNLIYGAVIGSSMLLPGVSGGTTAIMLGIYDRLLSEAGAIFRTPKKSLSFLGVVAVGGLVGLIGLSGVMLHLTEAFPILSAYFFIGAILGGLPILVKKSGISRHNLYLMAFAMMGVAAAVGIGFLPESSQLQQSPLLLVVSGIVIAGAMVLPGISTSHMLLTLGMYSSVLSAVRDRQIGFLCWLAAGAVLGTAAFVRLAEYGLKRFPGQTYMLIIGFVMASVYDIFPKGTQPEQLPLGILLAVAGFIAVCLLTTKAGSEQPPTATAAI